MYGLVEGIRRQPLQRYFRLTDTPPEGGGGGGGGGGGTGGDPPEPKPDPKTFDQTQVDTIVQGRVAETKRQTEERVAKELGVDLKEAKRIIDAARAAEDKDKSEAQRAKEEAEAAKATAESEKSESARERHAARVERMLIRAKAIDGIEEDDKANARLDRLSRLVDVEVGADEATIKTAIDKLKQEEPQLFGVSAEGNGKKPPPSDPKGTPPKPKGGDDAFARGAERAKERAAATGKGPGGYDLPT